jgi:uncharacterized membrane protein
MIWDRIFWLWFVMVSLLAVLLMLEETTTLSIIFGSLVVGLGLIKLAGERAGKSRTKVRRKLLDKLR